MLDKDLLIGISATKIINKTTVEWNASVKQQKVRNTGGKTITLNCTSPPLAIKSEKTHAVLPCSFHVNPPMACTKTCTLQPQCQFPSESVD